ncbi:MAG: BTAD domain-containing putative transcriptional regulator [Anaerolineales bacterium]
MSSFLELRLLGSPLILIDGQPLEGLPSRAAEALLMYLALQEQPVSREFLAELLWSERSQDQAMANLRSILSSLRKVLGDRIVATRQTVRFDRFNYVLDVEEFEREMQKLHPYLQSGAMLSPELAHRLGQALQRYQGDFLAGFYLRDGVGFEEWVVLVRERLRRTAHAGFRAMVRHTLAKGQYAEGLLDAEKLISLDPYDEDAHRQMMTLLMRSGQPNAALRQYETLRKLLRDELGVEPSSATFALYQRYRALPFPPPVHLPPDATPFLGREAEISDLIALLISPNTRLVTLFGPGGIGKTRLSVEVGRRLAQQAPGLFLDGIAFIPLDTVLTGSAMATMIAERIGLKFQGALSPQEQLLADLKNKETLLILDNFEHLLTPAEAGGLALLVSILGRCPAVKLLVTSRERLNLYEEVVFDVPGLTIPQPGEALTQGSAAALFLQTAQRVQRQFLPENAAALAIIRTCQLLQGVPLAIELAASWVRQYSPSQILQQVATSLDFLQTSFRNMPERHRSLRAVFDHSWDLLTPQEQGVFCQLAIFEGGFTREAAQAVVSFQPAVFSSDMPSTLKPDHLSLNTETWLLSLADKSLLQTQPDGRFALHPLLRQFAAEKQAEYTGVLDTVPHRHAEYYLNFLCHLGSGEEPEHRTAIRTDLPNLRLAWQWAAQTNDLIRLEQTAETLHNFFSIQSWFLEGIDLFEQALRQIPPQADSPAYASALCELLGRKARMYISLGQLENARVDLEKAVHYLQYVGDPNRRSVVLGYLAISNFYAGTYAQAIALALESLTLSEQTQNLAGIAFANNFLGSCFKAQGDYPSSRTYFERAVTAYRNIQDDIGAAMVLNNLGNLTQAMNDFDSAQAYYLECTRLFSAHDHTHGAATALSNAGKLALKRGDWPAARRLLEESLTLKRQMNDLRGVAVSLSGLGDLALSEGNLPLAREQLNEALKLAHEAGDVQLVLTILGGLGEWLWKAGEPEKAQHLLAYAKAHKATSQEVRERVEKWLAEIRLETPSNPWAGWALEKVVETSLALAQ